MKRLIAVAIRLMAKATAVIANFFRIMYLVLKYPGLKIDLHSKIARRCDIICVDGGVIIIKNASIAAGTHLFADTNARLSIMDSVIGRNCSIVAKESITINAGCAIAEMVVIRDQDHIVDTTLDYDVFSEYKTGKIEIGKNVWIASKATILKNVSIGSYAVVAASAVVTKSVPAYEIWGGIPAKFIKKVI